MSAQVVLAIDQSTSKSGWAVGRMDGARAVVLDSGVAKTAKDIARVIEYATTMALAGEAKLLAVLEDHRSFAFGRGNMSVKSVMGMGAARGRWEYPLELAGVRDVRFVEPRVWRAKVLGLGARVSGEVAKAKAKEWARALVKREASDDEAEALAMLMFALREPDSLARKVKPRKPKGNVAAADTLMGVWGLRRAK